MNSILDAERVWTRADREGALRKILIVDDEPDVRWVLATMFRDYGFEPVEARNGQEALEQLEATSPAVILMDVRMPVLDGVAALKKIRADHSDVPIVMITAYGDIGSAVEAMKLGAYDYVTKPFDDARVVRAVFGALERRAAEEARRDEEARFRSLAETASDAIISADSSGTIVFWNTAAQSMFGYTEEEALGKPLVFLMPERYRAPHQAALERVRFTGQQRLKGKTVELHGLRKGGTEFPIDISLPYAAWKKGDETFYSAIIRDATARKSSEEELRQSHKIEAVGQLAAGIAHDFNNLLTAILGYSELLLGKLGETHPLREDIAEIMEAGKRGAALTKQILAFGRKQIIQPRVLDLNTVVTSTEKLLRRVIGEDIEVAVHLGHGLGRVKVDSGQIEEVILNLAVNARDAMPEGGLLTIETANAELDEAYAEDHVEVVPGPHVMLAVSDTGCGMTPEVRAHLFEPFFTTKKRGKGTGLGLSTAHGTVKQSGGHIWVYSEPGHGTTFKIYLPRVDAAAESVAPREAESGRVIGTETVLLVEDDAAVRQLARRILERYGYTVLEAHGSDEAPLVSARHQGPIHLMVTDVVMPVVGGHKLAEHLTAERPEMKVLYVSGYTDDAIVRHGVLERNISFLQKPFTAAALARKVREVLELDAEAPPGAAGERQ